MGYPEKITILCPKCNSLSNWNSHFQGWVCEKCGYIERDIKLYAKEKTLSKMQ